MEMKIHTVQYPVSEHQVTDIQKAGWTMVDIRRYLNLKFKKMCVVYKNVDTMTTSYLASPEPTYPPGISVYHK